MNAMEFEDIGRVWREQSGEVRRTRVEDLSPVLDRAARSDAKVRRKLRLLIRIVLFPLVLAYTICFAQSTTILGGCLAGYQFEFADEPRGVPDSHTLGDHTNLQRSLFQETLGQLHTKIPSLCAEGLPGNLMKTARQVVRVHVMLMSVLREC